MPQHQRITQRRSSLLVQGLGNFSIFELSTRLVDRNRDEPFRNNF
jgi:hypothetical protein